MPGAHGLKRCAWKWVASGEVGLRVLVTGALGVNGVWVLRSLLERGVETLATDRAPDFALAPDLAELVDFRAVDVSSLDDVRRATAGFRPDCVLHLAALMVGACQADPHAATRVNLLGTANVLEAAAAEGVQRVVFTSSKGAYGEVVGRHAHPHYEPLTEDGPLRPVSVYDYLKVASEGLGANWTGLDFAALRFGTIYGPGKLARHGPMSLASRLVEEPLAGSRVALQAGGDQKDDLIYVRDVGEAIVAAALHARPFEHAVYNIGTGRAVTLDDLARAVRSELPSAEIEVGPGLDPMGMGISYYGVLDCSRAAGELGWRARFDLDEGVRDYIAQMRRLGFAEPQEAART
jgi:UDP-glucose 4-epimerase